MKRTRLFQFASLLLLATGCSQEELQHVAPSETVISAVMEDVTRSHATDEGKFTWTKGDKISVYTSSGSFRTFTLQGDGGTATANFTGTLLGTESITRCAAYPKSSGHKVSGNTFTFNMAAEYGDFATEYVPNTNAPMVALMNNSTDFNFKHLGGVLRFKLDNVPVGAAQFVFTAEDKDITGDFTVDLSATTPTISAKEKSGSNTITIKFKPLESVQDDMTFFVPLPVGTYNGFTIAMKKQDGTLLVDYTHESSNTLKRKSLARFPELKFADVTGSMEGEDTNIFTWTTVAVEPEKDVDGTYLIANAANMKWFMENGGASSDSFKLTTDIIMETSWNSVNDFEGTFDGDNHKIVGLSTSFNIKPMRYPGFFGYLSSNAIVKNLIFENPKINQSDSFSYGAVGVGVLAHVIWGDNVKILNCGVIGGTVHCDGNGSIDAHCGAFIGALNDCSSLLIKGCFVKNVTVDGWHMGPTDYISGFIGSLSYGYWCEYVTLESCYAKNRRIGHFAGF